MAELAQMIHEAKQWRAYHAAEFRKGVRGAEIEAAACAIREKALRDAWQAVYGGPVV